MGRRAFTLVELLVAIVIIGILAGLVLAALQASGHRAREARTRTIVTKLDRAIMNRWESYRTRRVPTPRLDDEDGDGSYSDGGGPTELTETGLLALGYNFTPGDPNYMGGPRAQAALRLAALRELMRFEMPQRYSDITDDPVVINRPSLSQSYARQWVAAGSPTAGDYQAAECLYLIVTSGGLEDDPLGEDHFRHEDVADVDDNGLNEFVDGYGNPVRWLRWPVATVSDLQPDPTTAADNVTFCRDYHDPFDPARIDMPGFNGVAATAYTGYRLFPLIYSAGPDGIYDIEVGAGSATFATAADYFQIYQSTIGQPIDSDNISFTATGTADGEVSAFDNLTNHTTTQAIR